MAQTLSGLHVVPPEGHDTVEKQAGSFVYININTISKKSWKPGERDWCRCSIQVPMDEIEQAREALKPGSIFYVRFGELVGNRLQSGFVAMTASIQWKHVEALKVMPQTDSKPKFKNY